jgi:hypothetical protein
MIAATAKNVCHPPPLSICSRICKNSVQTTSSVPNLSNPGIRNSIGSTTSSGVRCRVAASLAIANFKNFESEFVKLQHSIQMDHEFFAMKFFQILNGNGSKPYTPKRDGTTGLTSCQRTQALRVKESKREVRDFRSNAHLRGKRLSSGEVGSSFKAVRF